MDKVDFTNVIASFCLADKINAKKAMELTVPASHALFAYPDEWIKEFWDLAQEFLVGMDESLYLPKHEMIGKCVAFFDLHNTYDGVLK